MSRPLAVVRSLDHLVLTCSNVSRTVDWYSKYLGMKHEVFTPAAEHSVQRHALKFGEQKINLHQQHKEFEPKAATALPGTADLCFVMQEGTDLVDLIEGFKASGVDVLEGAQVVHRTGAQGPIKSIYVRDPDGNLVE